MYRRHRTSIRAKLLLWVRKTVPRHVAKPDVVKPSYPREEVLSNAPESEEGYFGVPRVVDRSH